MIPKSGKYKSDPSNYRPISLLNSIAKLFAALLLSRVKKHTMSHIRSEQFAFRTEHSTTNQLPKLIDELVISHNRKERTTAIFLDFDKAFDKVWAYYRKC